MCGIEYVNLLIISFIGANALFEYEMNNVMVGKTSLIGACGLNLLINYSYHKNTYLMFSCTLSYKCIKTMPTTRMNAKFSTISISVDFDIDYCAPFNIIQCLCTIEGF